MALTLQFLGTFLLRPLQLITLPPSIRPFAANMVGLLVAAFIGSIWQIGYYSVFTALPLLALAAWVLAKKGILPTSTTQTSNPEPLNQWSWVTLSAIWATLAFAFQLFVCFDFVTHTWRTLYYDHYYYSQIANLMPLAGTATTYPQVESAAFGFDAAGAPYHYFEIFVSALSSCLLSIPHALTFAMVLPTLLWPAAASGLLALRPKNSRLWIMALITTLVLCLSKSTMLWGYGKSVYGDTTFAHLLFSTTEFMSLLSPQGGVMMLSSLLPMLVLLLLLQRGHVLAALFSISGFYFFSATLVPFGGVLTILLGIYYLVRGGRWLYLPGVLLCHLCWLWHPIWLLVQQPTIAQMAISQATQNADQILWHKPGLFLPLQMAFDTYWLRLLPLVICLLFTGKRWYIGLSLSLIIYFLATLEMLPETLYWAFVIGAILFVAYRWHQRSPSLADPCILAILSIILVYYVSYATSVMEAWQLGFIPLQALLIAGVVLAYQHAYFLLNKGLLFILLGLFACNGLAMYFQNWSLLTTTTPVKSIATIWPYLRTDSVTRLAYYRAFPSVPFIYDGTPINGLLHYTDKAVIPNLYIASAPDSIINQVKNVAPSFYYHQPAIQANQILPVIPNANNAQNLSRYISALQVKATLVHLASAEKQGLPLSSFGTATLSCPDLPGYVWVLNP